jgi:uncharacterized membrane protein YeaQ/YmgE (transglycosylase-associated protein family)
MEHVVVLAAEAGLMHWVWVIVVGGIIGWLASIVMKTNAQMGLLANIIIGIVGSALGAWLAGLLGIGGGGLIVTLLIGIAGAALLIFLLRALGILK